MTPPPSEDDNPRLAENGNAAIVATKPAPLSGERSPVVTDIPAAIRCSGNWRILLVEDNATCRLVTMQMLESLGHECVVAMNGAEALLTLQTVPCDLVLMDCQMPEMDGFEATRRIRSCASGSFNPKVPIIALTAFTLHGDRERCLEAGMDACLYKPVQLGELSVVLEHWLSRQPTIRGESAPEPSDASSVVRAPCLSDSMLPVFDRVAFLERLMGDEDLARTMCTGFIADMSEQLRLLAAAFASGDREQVLRRAHRIKGAAAVVGGEALCGTALLLEKSAAAGELQTMAVLLCELEGCFARLRAAMVDQLFLAGC